MSKIKDAKQTITLIFLDCVYKHEFQPEYAWKTTCPGLPNKQTRIFNPNSHGILTQHTYKKRTCFHDLARPVHPPYTY